MMGTDRRSRARYSSRWRSPGAVERSRPPGTIDEPEFIDEGLPTKHGIDDVNGVGSPFTNDFYVRAPKGSCYGTPLDPKHVDLRRLNYKSPFPSLHYVGASNSLPGLATAIHFACMQYRKLTGDRAYQPRRVEGIAAHPVGLVNRYGSG